MNDERELLIEAALTPFRERDASGRIRPSAAWQDLDEAGRARLFEEQLVSRSIEQVIDPGGLSGTGRDVLQRALTLPQAD